MIKRYNYNQLELPLLETLNDLGGRAKTKDVYSALAKKLCISEEERNEKIDSSTKHRRWDRMVRWVKQNLKIDGYLTGNIKGIWELTEKAKSFLQNAVPGVLITVYEVVDDNNNVQGLALWGEVSAAKGVIEDNSINLTITSPPYPHVWQREYGNVGENEYVDWFLPIARQIYNQLTEDGSFILNLANVYKKGSPEYSLYIHELILALCKDVGFHYYPTHYWHNAGKLPRTWWVTVKRIHVNDTIENMFWFTKSLNAKANNRNVLKPYSENYKKILSKGGYGKAMRPSGHLIDHFNKDNNGKIPSTLLVANTVSTDPYIRYCKENNITVHPARFPPGLVDYFIKLCSDPGDIVYDAFCGSNIVGEACYRLGRKFIGTEKSLTYLKGSIGRFNINNVKAYEPITSTL